MTADRLRDCASVHGYVGRICFKNGPPRHLGAEIELITGTLEPGEPVSLPRIKAALAAVLPLPHGSTLTFEPGGQVELSSLAHTDLTSLVTALQADLDVTTSALSAAGLTVVESAVDPVRPPKRWVHSARYDAMESYFDAREAALPPAQRVGRAMMASTAALQVNLDAGADPAVRWRLLHDLGPVLVAAFANSPTRLGACTGWKSSRQQIWQQLDPSRTSEAPGPDPVSAYAGLALDAPVMMVRRADRFEAAPGFTFRQWVESDDPPTDDDLAYHLSTLFPPVRPRGWFEVRYLDTPPLRWWAVPLALLSALVDDPAAATEAAALARPARGRWRAAASGGLDDPVLADAGAALFDLAATTLQPSAPVLAELVRGYCARYVAQRRCPADDHQLVSASPEA